MSAQTTRPATRRTSTAARRATPSDAATGATTPTVRVALYRRASTDEGNQPFSLDAQEQRLLPYVASQPGWTVVGDYVERASAKDVDGRPELQRLLADAERGRFDLVLVARIDRWSRSLIDLLDTVDHLAGHGVGFHSATEHFDTATPLGTLLLQMLGMFAQFERSMIIDRIQRGNAAKIAKGIPLTSRVGYGLAVDAEGRITSDPATIGVVRRIFDEYVNQQRGARAIANGLNDNAVPGPGARGWSQSSVAKVLRNRAFVGEVRHLTTWHPGAHEALIDPDLFEQAQAIADLRSTDAAAASTRRGEFVLTGTIRCGRCDGSYVGTSGTGRTGGVVRYYSCGTARRYGSKQCTGPSLPAQDLEHLVTEALLTAYSDSTLFEEAIEAHLTARDSRQAPLTEQLQAASSVLAAKQRVRNRYQDDYESGSLTAARFEARAAELDDELLALRTHVADLELQLQAPTLPAVPTQRQLDDLRAHLVAGIRDGDVSVRKSLYGALVDGIVVHDRDDIRPTFRLYDPAAADVLATNAHDTDDDNAAEMATDGLRFASRPSRWS
ncbi:recombinase family protein [Nocardioides sp. GCM10027113]|uniref:recombinase family protein n=1 Tax=unclassified Nocardioides TaxID=2615069 RepID=UPI00361FE9A5